MEGKVRYKFETKMWKDLSAGGWYFVSLPMDISYEIREHFQWQEEGWGRMKITAQIDDTNWKTSIWFDVKLKVYLLPIKADIRKKLNLEIGKEIGVSIWV